MGIALSLAVIFVINQLFVHRSVWAWIELLIVPAVLAGGGIWFNTQQRAREQQTANDRPRSIHELRGISCSRERDGKVWLNPTFLIKTGDGFSASLTNGLDEETTVHWHGLHLHWRMDGHPLRAVHPGAGYRYAYSVANRGGTYWYHTHGHGNTARQVYTGLAGLFIVEDNDERRVNEALGVELGETDLPVIIQDKNFDGEGNLLYDPDEMARSMGYTGNVILVNMTPAPCFEVGTRLYRLRLLNGSNALVGGGQRSRQE
jgi:FtsP/CotA-like multicopper oxidase with cupredoxin domain